MKIFFDQIRNGGWKNRLTHLAVVLLLAAFCLAGQTKARAQDCSNTSTGMVPLTDLGTSAYKGQYEGGLYPNGSNVCPEVHKADGLAIAKSIEPLNASGQPDSNGKIVMVSIGMSNTQQEFQPFIEKATLEPELNPNLVLVNGADAGQHAGKWQNPASLAWMTLADRVSEAGATAQQVQVAWILLAMRTDVGAQTFPEHANMLKDAIRTAVQILKDNYPNVKIAYLSSRIYAGYAPPGSISAEPFAYEGGFSMKWLIEDQINESPDLSYKGDNPEAPWLVWGPYLWADGLGSDGVEGGVPGRSDGLEWTCSDFFGVGKNDGVHPSISGADKIGGILLDFFKQEPTSLPWFMPNAATPVELAGFESIVSGADVILKWMTASEVDNYGFEIQRAQNLTDFQPIAFVEGRGTTAEANSYTYRDENLQPGRYEYRLKQMDLDGESVLSSTLTVYIQAPKVFKLEANYPNPFRGATTLTYQSPERTLVTVRIYNVLGQEITQLMSTEIEAGLHTIRWDGRDRNGHQVAPGMYFVTLLNSGPQGQQQIVAQQKILHIR